MDYPTTFHLISDIFKKTGVSCILVGGFAVNYYKYSRQTGDIDFLITENDFIKISDFLKNKGYSQEHVQKLFIRFKSDKGNLMDLDFLFTDKETIEKMKESGKEVDIAGQKFIIPSLNNLIAMKLHAMKNNPQFRKNWDLLDIVNLISINKIDVKSSDFKELCLKYGTEEIYKRITESA